MATRSPHSTMIGKTGTSKTFGGHAVPDTVCVPARFPDPADTPGVHGGPSRQASQESGTTSVARPTVAALRVSLHRIRSASFPTEVKEVCATIVHVVYPVEPGWESEDCPIGQPPDPIPNGTGDKSRVEQRRRKKRR